MPRSSSVIRVANLSKKRRSWVINSMQPLNPSNISSSHSIALKSKWLVGSSNKSTSGSATRARPNATRLRQPPDKVDTNASASSFNRLKTVSTRDWAAQPFCVSKSCCRVCILSIKVSISASGMPMSCVTWW